MSSPALPLPPSPLLAPGRAAPQRRIEADTLTRQAAAMSTAAAADPLSRLGTAPYARASQRPMGLLVLALHGAAVWGLLQLGPVRDTLREVAPVMVSLIDTPAAAPAAPPPLPAPPKLTRPEPAPLLPPPPVVIQTAAPAPPPQPVAVQADPAPAPAPAAPAPVAAPTAAPASPSPAPAPVAAGPRMLPTSAIHYLGAGPDAEFPRASRRLRESGRVVVRVLVSESGLPERLSVERSSGFARLDEAALAAVRKVRFKPYVENGQAQSGWALIPISFELEP